MALVHSKSFHPCSIEFHDFGFYPVTIEAELEYADSIRQQSADDNRNRSPEEAKPCQSNGLFHFDNMRL